MSSKNATRVMSVGAAAIVGCAGFFAGSLYRGTEAAAEQNAGSSGAIWEVSELVIIPPGGGDRAVVIGADGFAWTIDCGGQASNVASRVYYGSIPAGKVLYRQYVNFRTGLLYTDVGGGMMIPRSEIDAAGGLEAYLESRPE